MARGYHEWNRSFMTTEGRSKRTKTDRCRCITPSMDNKENHWNRMSLMRLRYHPTMRLPRDPYIPYQYSAVAPTFAITNDGISVSAPNGLGSIEFQVDGQYVKHLEYPFVPSQGGEKDGSASRPPPQQIQLSTSEIGELASVDPLSRKVTITAVGTDQRQAEIEDYGNLLKTSRLVIKTSPEGPAQPVPTSSPADKLKQKLSKFTGGSSRSSGHMSPTALAHTHNEKATAGPGEMVVIKGLPVGQEKKDNTWMTILNSHQGQRPKLVKVDVSLRCCPWMNYRPLISSHTNHSSRISTKGCFIMPF